MQGFAVIRAGLKTNSRVVGELRHNNVHVTSLWCTKIFVPSVAYQLWREIGWGDLAVVLWYIVVVPPITTISGKLMYGFQVRSNPCTKMKIQMHPSYFNTLRPRQNGRHFADDIFKCIFSERKRLNSYLNFTEVCSQGSNQQYASIGSDNGLAPSRRQAIIWTNDG